METLRFDNRFTRDLPGDPEESNSRRQVLGACYSRVAPVKVSSPRLVAYAPEVAALLGLSPEDCHSQEFLQIFAGNRILEGMDPHATCYGGHQFGHWAGQLGDGRAINLGEVINSRRQRWILQLKGAGPTPYSRTADGLAVLRSSVREFLCSEAMYHLGVPTTRALSLVATGEPVLRDMFYDGHARQEPGAVVCRVAPSFTRFGHFEIFAARGDTERLRLLADHTIRTDFPHLGEPTPQVYGEWFVEVCRLTAEMVVHWLRVGFVHGVMNTDNMSIMGLTIDYGPYGWLDNFDRAWTPNTTDASGRRYRFGQQGPIAHWNLAQLANALYGLVEEEAPFHQGLALFESHYDLEWRAMMAAKLGLTHFEAGTDVALFDELMNLLEVIETDMTLFYRHLAQVPARGEFSDHQLTEYLAASWYLPQRATPDYRARLGDWLRRYRKCLQTDGLDDEERRRLMNQVNPKYVLRNCLAQLAIDKAEAGDDSLVNELLEVLRYPYDEQPGQEFYAQKRPDWARHRAGCSMLSCSS